MRKARAPSQPTSGRTSSRCSHRLRISTERGPSSVRLQPDLLPDVGRTGDANIGTVLKRLAVALFLAGAVVVHAQLPSSAAIRYHLSFPEPQHRWMQVEALFP